MRTAEGWPAVLGLAAMSGDVDFTSSRLLSRTLYDFLASELLDAAADETQAGLMLLAVATWLGVRAIDADYGLRYALLCAGGLAIALADAAKTPEQVAAVTSFPTLPTGKPDRNALRAEARARFSLPKD